MQFNKPTVTMSAGQVSFEVLDVATHGGAVELPAVAVVRLLRSARIEGPGPDRHLSPEIETAVDLVAAGAVLHAVEEVIGELR